MPLQMDRYEVSRRTVGHKTPAQKRNIKIPIQSLLLLRARAACNVSWSSWPCSVTITTSRSGGSGGKRTKQLSCVHRLSVSHVVGRFLYIHRRRPPSIFFPQHSDNPEMACSDLSITRTKGALCSGLARALDLLLGLGLNFDPTVVRSGLGFGIAL